MATLGSYSYVYGPIMAFAAVGVLIALLRWTFRRGRSVVARTPRAGEPTDYGLLVAVAEPGSFAEAELVRRRLLGHRIRATLAPTTDGPRVLVFPEEESAARALLSGPR